MRLILATGIVSMLAGSLVAFAASKEDVAAAAKKLGADSYAWTSTVKVPEGSPMANFRPSPTEGKYAKDGTYCVTTTMRDNTVTGYIKGEKGVVKTDDGWKTFDELTSGGGGQPNPGMFRGRMLRNAKSPNAQVESLLEGVKELKDDAGACTAELQAEAVKKLMSFGRGGQGPETKDAKGSVKFWLKDGALVKYEFSVQGTITGRDNNEMKIDRTTTVEIKDVGTTKLEVPEDVKKKL